MTTAQILFENDAIRVLFLPGQANRLLITFGDAAHLADGARFYAEPVARQAGWPALGFMAKDAHWYDPADIASALPALRFTLSAFAERTVHGSSMGAYAAIKYAARLGATQVIAYCPQYSIDPAELAGARSGYEANFRPSMRGMGIKPGDASGVINVFFDPFDAADANHARLIAQAVPGARLFRVPHVGHHLTPVLAGAALTQAIFQACADGDANRIYRLVNGARRASGWRQQFVLQRGIVRHGKLAARALRGLIARGRLFIPNSLQAAPALFDAMLRQSEPDLAHSVLRKLCPSMPAPRARLIASDLDDLARGEPWVSACLMTVHETILVYDAVTARLAHRIASRDRNLMVGKHHVFLCEVGDMHVLAVRVEQTILACGAGGDDASVNLLPLHAAGKAACFVAQFQRENALRIKHGDNFLHAMPNGCVNFAQQGEKLWQRLISL